jgi:hypothetical protein
MKACCKCVLGFVLVAEHVPAVGQQRRLVALEDLLERALVACLQAPYERRVVVPGAHLMGIYPHH